MPLRVYMLVDVVGDEGLKAADIATRYNEEFPSEKKGLFGKPKPVETGVIAGVLRILHDEGLITHPDSNGTTRPEDLVWKIRHDEPAPEAPTTPPASA